jgi:hypothetical protein
MKKLLVLLACAMLVSSLGFAQADPDDNSFGFFFDTEATLTELHTPAPFTPITGYLVVSNPTSASISGWECFMDIAGAPIAMSWAVAGGGLNVFGNGNDGNFNVGVGLAPNSLLPVGGVCVLATFTCYVGSPTDVITFTVLPFPGSVTFSNAPGYVDGSNVGLVIPCGVSTGYPYGAYCAVINGTGVVADEPMSWSGVKALFN